MLGWRRDDSPIDSEIEVLCDSTDDVIAGRLKELIEEYDDGEGFLFIYLAGHGVQINSRNYMFAHRATLDMQRAAQRLQSNHDNVVFQGQSIELIQDLFSRANDFYNGNVLLVLDSCRDDPLYLSTMATELKVPITAPQLAQQSDGIMVLYATTPGKRVSDGTGTSFLADAFVRHIQPGVTVDKVVSEVKKDVRAKTRTTAVPQAPERMGSLNNPDLCFSGCAPPAGATGGAGSRSPSNAVSLLSMSALSLSWFPMEGLGWASHLGKPVRIYKDVYRSPDDRAVKAASNVADMNVDVLWCEDEAGGREVLATTIADKISQKKNVVIGDSRLERVRLRPLGKEENERPAYRVSNNIIRVHKDSIRQLQWAEEISALSDVPLVTEAESSNTLDSISVILCGGVQAAESAPRVWIHVPSVEQQGVGLLLGEQIRRRYALVKVEGYIDVVPESPDATQVRFFHEEDRTSAEEVASAAGARLGGTPAVVFMPEYAERMAPKRLELWLGKQRESASLLPSVDL